MERKLFRASEVISFLELKILSNLATDEEMYLYEVYKWEGKLIKNNTYKSLARELKAEYNGEF